jgi:hypothetical protein
MTTTIQNILANMTEAEINAGIDEAMAEAVRIGLIVLTGEKEWSERRQCLMPVYKSLVYQPLLSEVEPQSRQPQQIHNPRIRLVGRFH